MANWIKPENLESAPRQVPAEWNLITERIIGCAIEVHSHLGPGLLERLYEVAMIHELRESGLDVVAQVPVTLRYKSIDLPEQRLDLVVNDLVIVELKSVEAVHEIHLAQLLSYLRSINRPLGLLINFNVPLLVKGVHRRINGRAIPLSDSAIPFSSPLSSSPRSSVPL